MHEDGVVKVREMDGTVEIPLNEVEELLNEPALDQFVEQYGELDATNIDKALEMGLIKKEDYETTKQQLEDDLTRRATEDQENLDSPEDTEGKAQPEEKLSIGDQIRKGKIDTKGAAMSTVPGFPQAWNLVVETVATLVDAGVSVAEAIEQAIAKLKKQDIYKSLTEDEQYQMEADIREGINDAIPDEAKPEPRDSMTARVKARKEEEQKVTAKKQAEASRYLDEHLVDVKEPFKKAIKREGKSAAQKLINRINLEAGASAAAKFLLQKYQKSIFGKGMGTMSRSMQSLMSDIIDLKRTIELDALYEKRRNDPEYVAKQVDEKYEAKLQRKEAKLERELTEEEQADLRKDAEREVKQEMKNLKHEGGITGEAAQVVLDEFMAKEDYIQELYGIKDRAWRGFDPNNMMESIDNYHQAMRDMLKWQYDEGVISEAAYEKLRDEQPYYSPRKYISHMDDMDPGGAISGVKNLSGGAFGAKVVDANTLLADVVARTAGIVAHNKKMQEAETYAGMVDSDIIQKAPYTASFAEKIGNKPEGAAYLEPVFKETPKGYTAVNYMADGEKRRLWIESDLYKYFDYAKPDEATEAALYTFSMMTGTPVLKFFATGMNPEFAIKNLPIDALHSWMTTTEYSRTMPIAWLQMLRNYAMVAKDAWKKRGRYAEYIKQGGGMDFLTTQGSRTPYKYGEYTKLTSSVESVRNGFAKLGEFSEVWTRLALREQYIRNHTEEEMTEKEKESVREDGTAVARGYLDFAQGGTTAKMLDKFLPYFNAGIQVTRGSLKAAHNDRAAYWTKFGQIAGLATFLTAWNMGDFGDDEKARKRRKAYKDDLNPDVKARNFIIMTNMSYRDSEGRDRYVYVKVPKDALQSSITSLFEDSYVKMFHDGEYKLMDDKMMTSLNNDLRNLTDLTGIPPVMRAVIGGKMNYDLFYNEEIWKGKDMAKWEREGEFYDGVTPPRFVKFGHLTGASPLRSQYVAKQFFTEGNMYGAIVGEFLDLVATGFEADQSMKVLGDDGITAETLIDAPFSRRVMKATFPQQGKEAEEAQLEMNRMQVENDHRLNQIVGSAETPGEIDHDAVNELLENTYEENGSYEAERLIGKLNTRMEQSGVSAPIRKLKWLVPEAQAIGFYYLVKDHPEKMGEYMQQAQEAGIASERFREEVGRLMQQNK